MTVEERKQMIARILMPRPDVIVGPGAIADRALWSWERIAFHLTPLIGEGGFQSLYLRALHLALLECPNITPMKRSSSTEDLFQKLREDLSLLDMVTTEFCSNLLMNKFIELVSSMIGESLTGQILRSAWEDPAAQGNAVKDGE
jgi:hypothetical protein